MFLSYDTIGYLKGPDIALVKDVETGTVAVRKKLRAELLGVYERLKSVEQANLPRVYETEEYEGECFAYYEYIEGETLEDIYRRFNIDHPEDFRGHSLSVSDVVVLHENGADTTYYVDSIGFRELPDFFGAGAPEAKRDISVREQLDNARKQAAQAEPKVPDKKLKEPERS